MTTAALPTQPPVWTARYARGLLVLTHVPLILFMAGAVLTGYGFPSPEPREAGLVLLLAAGSIQIRHSLAAARGVRPRGWALTLLLLLALAYVPLPFFDVRSRQRRRLARPLLSGKPRGARLCRLAVRIPSDDSLDGRRLPVRRGSTRHDCSRTARSQG